MKRKFHFISLLILVLLVNTLTYGQGDLMIMPKRLVFDGTQRSQEINLANTGKDTAVYAVSFINYKMTELGSFEQIETPEKGQRFATEFLRYFPRRVTLAPNEAQTIRVQLTRTGNLEEGEYRSHMYFRAVQEQSALGEDDSTSSEGIAIKIKTVFGISIPVIIRNGKSNTEVSISDISLNFQVETPQISMIINRTGNMSVYGNIEVEHISTTGITTQVGLVKGISVYNPNGRRHFKMNLKNIESVDFTVGKLKIKYISETGQEFAKFEKTL